MKFENVNLELFKKLLEHKKEEVKKTYNASLDSFRKEAIADELTKINFCLEEIDKFQEGLADDELEKNLKLNDK